MTPFRPGEVAVGGEIGRRMEMTLAKMLRHTDIDGTFARHFRVRKEKPDEPGGFAGYGMFLDALVKAAAHGIGGEETIEATFRNRNRLRTVKRLPLTRYSADIHDRTYFDPVKLIYESEGVSK